LALEWQQPLECGDRVRGDLFLEARDEAELARDDLQH